MDERKNEIGTVRLGNVYNDEKFTGGNYGGNVWGGQGVAPTLRTGASASQQCVIIETEIGNERCNDN